MPFFKFNTKVFYIILFLFSIFNYVSFAQINIDDVLQKKSFIYNDAEFEIYEFIEKQAGNNEHKIKVKYLVKDAYQKFIKLKKNKNILLVTAASFTSTFFYAGTPIGICAYKGEFLNKMPNQDMDGLVVENPNGLLNGNYVTDLDVVKKHCKKIECNHFFQLNPRESALDSYLFYNWVQSQQLSVFQTQLVYSHLKTKEENFKNLTVGEDNKRRRVLVIAKKNNVLTNTIVDCKNSDYVMQVSKDVYEMMTKNGYNVNFILNLDTGSKNLLYVNNGKDLENLTAYVTTKFARIERASNLIVYYIDK